MLTTLMILLPAAQASSLPGDEAPWAELADKPVPVACAEISGEPWCRSEGVISAPLEQVSQALQNMRYNADMFESVASISVLSDDLLHITLDYPSPLDDRDYVAKYTFSTDGDAHLFRWTPATDPGAPEVDGVVRLPNFAGEWRLEARGSGTWVRYTWQAEINGSFPSWGYSQARKKAGYEALKDLANTQKAELSAP
jgi:hypothetical protein